LIKQNQSKPEYKTSLQSFGSLLSDLNNVLTINPQLFKTFNNKFLLPQIFSFITDLLEKYDRNDENMLQPIIFEIFERLLKVIPESKQVFKEEQYFLNDYSSFLTKLLILCLDTKGADNKQNYMKALKTLSEKTPNSFIKEKERAINDRSFAKIDLFKELGI